MSRFCSEGRGGASSKQDDAIWELLVRLAMRSAFTYMAAAYWLCTRIQRAWKTVAGRRSALLGA